MNVNEKELKSIILEHFDSIRQKIDRQIDELLEIPKNEYKLNKEQIMLLREKFMRTTHHFRDSFLDETITLPIEIKEKEEIKSLIFKEKFLIYLPCPYNEDNSIIGKLILLKQYIPSYILEIIEGLILNYKNSDKFLINHLDQENLFAFYLLKQFDPLLNHHPAHSNRQDIWLSSDLSIISHVEDVTLCDKIDLSNTQITSVEPKCFSLFKNLHTLNLSENFLTRLDHELDGLEALKILNLEINNLSHLGTELCRDLHQLNLLNLHKNKLILIDKCLFKNLSSLLYLDLSNNSIQSIHKDAFDSLKNLKDLNLRKNEIDFIDKNWFKNLHHLEALNLSHNFLISSLECGQFLGLKNLKKLNLSKIRLENLQDLILAECDLDSKLSKEFFQCVPTLKLLSLDNNKINNLDNLLDLLPQLEVLSLSCNQIETIADNCFSYQSNLKIINLGFNKLRSVLATWLHKMPNLQRIYLNNNEISELDENLFDKLIKLNTLDISGNKIKSVNENHFNGIFDAQITYDEILGLDSIIKDFKERKIDLIPELTIAFVEE
ncbi:leucine-rich repeat-containing 15 [Brachionus plicatilis]|uniref:Leucine-rich repeat-containing 15 n=1 Tax=Brachionus plicatilis TaxID=10195 RepID=A0A3M7PRT9_BRAPC|nr:leucine-rich repeat-containing 15 [Brachionus plicatilis]